MGMSRRCPLWPETLDALREAILLRPAATLPEHDDLVFITKYGGPWAKETSDSPVTKEFRKLLDYVDRADQFSLWHAKSSPSLTDGTSETSTFALLSR